MPISNPNEDYTGKCIKDTYQSVVHVGADNILYDGTGSCVEIPINNLQNSGSFVFINNSGSLVTVDDSIINVTVENIISASMKINKCYQRELLYAGYFGT